MLHLVALIDGLGIALLRIVGSHYYHIGLLEFISNGLVRGIVTIICLTFLGVLLFDQGWHLQYLFVDIDTKIIKSAI
jgi:hypothetical protein